MKADTIITNIGSLISLVGSSKPRRGKDMESLGMVKDAAIAIKDGLILGLSSSLDINLRFQSRNVIDVKGKVVLPGFVDCHTHPVFVHTREDEFAMRIAGKSYVEIAQAGGGIRSTIASTRDASEDLLFELAAGRIKKMISQGTTTLEAKSGYGLDTNSELKLLRVIKRLANDLPIDIVPTFMGAHEYPAEYKNDHETYLKILCEEMIPAVAEQGVAEFCDIFTEAHVFSIEESRRVLQCARDHGLKLKMHADEIEPIGGAELAAELGCVSADHLGATGDAGIASLHKAGVIPVLLPATLFSLRSKTYARALDMISKGLPVAIATDYNPGSCNCDSMPFTMTLACLQMGMSPAQALVASTINAAHAISLGSKLGTLEAGKQADFCIWDIPNLNFLPYHFGSSNLSKVFKMGKCIYSADEQ
jgi:imidazolonepropionase